MATANTSDAQASKKIYQTKVFGPDARGKMIEKPIKIKAGQLIAEIRVPDEFNGQVAFHVENNNGLIYPCYSKVSSQVGGKFVIENGVVTATDGSLFIIEAIEREVGNKIVQSFMLYHSEKVA